MLPISLTELTNVSRFYNTKEAIKYQNHPIIKEITEIVKLAKEKMYLGAWSEAEYLEFSKRIGEIKVYDFHFIYPVIQKMLEQRWEIICQDLDRIKCRDFFDTTIPYESENKIQLLVELFKQIKSGFTKSMDLEYVGIKRNVALTNNQKIEVYEMVLAQLEKNESDANNRLRESLYQWITSYFAGSPVEKELFQLIELMVSERRNNVKKRLEEFRYVQQKQLRRSSIYDCQTWDNAIKKQKRTSGYHTL